MRGRISDAYVNVSSPEKADFRHRRLEFDPNCRQYAFSRDIKTGRKTAQIEGFRGFCAKIITRFLKIRFWNSIFLLCVTATRTGSDEPVHCKPAGDVRRGAAGEFVAGLREGRIDPHSQG